MPISHTSTVGRTIYSDHPTRESRRHGDGQDDREIDGLTGGRGAIRRMFAARIQRRRLSDRC